MAVFVRQYKESRRLVAFELECLLLVMVDCESMEIAHKKTGQGGVVMDGMPITGHAGRCRGIPAGT